MVYTLMQECDSHRTDHHQFKQLALDALWSCDITSRQLIAGAPT